MSVSQAKNPLTADMRTALLERWCEELVEGYLHERRVDLPRLERFALDALKRPEGRYAGEHAAAVAQAVLNIDIPRKERSIDAALLILQCADFRERALFILKAERRSSMIAAVQRASGLTNPYGKWVAL